MAETFEQPEFLELYQNLDHDHQRLERAPKKKLGGFDIMCLLLNRTIGSGIFVAPGKVLIYTGSVPAALCLWVFGAVIHLCALYTWLELGLAIPFRKLSRMGTEISVPRSGGEKNFLEYIFSKPKMLTTCMYGIPYIILGVLSGNAIAFGQFIMEAAGRTPSHDTSDGLVIAIALIVLTSAVLIHVYSRRGGILINNTFAVVKVCILFAIIVLGAVKAAGADLGEEPAATNNYDSEVALSGPKRGVADYAKALTYVLYSYSGFQQPFYVLGEVRNPRELFPRYTTIGLIVGATLFISLNAVYLLIVPKDLPLENPDMPMATLFFGQMFGNVPDSDELASEEISNTPAMRAFSGLVALSIFGNLVVMTFTSSRVKQEVAKEGILPKSLFFATSHTTPHALIRTRHQSEDITAETVQNEQSPMAALGLHWVVSVILVGATAMLPPAEAYSVLVELYSFVVRIMVPIFVSGGLLYYKMKPSIRWSSKVDYIPLKYPIHVVLYLLTLLFLFFGSFFQPTAGSQGDDSADVAESVKWFIIPSIGTSSLLWGVVWYLCLKLYMISRRRRLIFTRTACVREYATDRWVQEAELIESAWHTLGDEALSSGSNHSLQEVYA